MATRKKGTPRRTTVTYTVNGAMITVEELPASKAGPVLAAIIEVVRGLQKKYPELRPVHTTTGGYSPVEYVDDLDWSEGPRKIGFNRK